VTIWLQAVEDICVRIVFMHALIAAWLDASRRCHNGVRFNTSDVN